MITGDAMDRESTSISVLPDRDARCCKVTISPGDRCNCRYASRSKYLNHTMWPEGSCIVVQCRVVDMLAEQCNAAL